MQSNKGLSISLLGRMLQTYISTKQYAEYKLGYLTGSNPNTIKEIAEFEKMAADAEKRISELEKCIIWISELPEPEQLTLSL